MQWLSPPADAPYGVDFYVSDLARLYNFRQRYTCHWILDNAEYIEWVNSSPQSEKSLLWITAIPGAGKSTLASFVSVHQLCIRPNETFYFFFNNSNSYQTTTICAGRCILYQLYINARQAGMLAHPELESAIADSGGGRAKSFETVWTLVLAYATRLDCTSLHH